MKFGYFDNLHDVTNKRDYGDLIREMRELAQLCEDAGLDVFWVPEHHFSVWGRELLANPLMMAADIASRTKRIRVGLSAAIIAFWHPLRLAEDLALLDHLTDGRLEIGVGRGNYALEATNLNPAADPRDPAKNLKVFLETLDILQLALSQDRFSYKGEIYTFPAPGFSADKAHSVKDPAYIDAKTGELTKLTTYPRPKQKPTPPIWQMVSEAHDAIRGAAARDMGVIMWRPSLKELKLRLQIFKETYEAKLGRKIALGAKTAVARDTFVAGSEAEARKIAEPYAMDSLNFANWRGPRIYLDPDETLAPDAEAALKKKLTYDFVAPRALFFGAAEQVAQKMDELHRETNIEQLIFKCGWPGLAHKETMRCMERMARDVLPQVRAGVAARTAPKAAAD